MRIRSRISAMDFGLVCSARHPRLDHFWLQLWPSLCQVPWSVCAASSSDAKQHETAQSQQEAPCCQLYNMMNWLLAFLQLDCAFSYCCYQYIVILVHLPLQFPCNWQEGGFQDKRNYQCLLVAVVKLEQFAISHQTSKHINVLRQQAVWPLTSLQQYYLLLGYVCFRATLNFAKCINAYKTWCDLVPWSVRCIFVWCQAAWNSTMSPRSFMLSTLSTLQYDEFVTGFQPARMCVLSLLLQGCKSCAAPSIAQIWAKMDQIHGTA